MTKGNSLHPDWRTRPRRRIQRVFLDWLWRNRHRMAVPLRVLRRTDDSLALGFVGLTSLLSVCLGSYSLTVNAVVAGEIFDGLADFECALRWRPNGYVCECCDPAGRALYPSRAALWCDHLFEPFLKWTNERLTTARYLKFTDIGNGAIRSASLCDDPVSVVDAPLARLLGGLRKLDGSPACALDDEVKRMQFVTLRTGNG